MSDKTHILFLGAPYWAAYLAKLLPAYSNIQGYTLRRSWRWLFSANKRVCLVGLGAPNTWRRKVYHYTTIFLYLFRVTKQPVLYWIGSDVLLLKSGIRAIFRYHNIAGASWLATEVCELGYDCNTSLFPVSLEHVSASALPDTDKLQVLCYVPDSAPEIHGGPGIAEVARRCVNIDFHVLGGKGIWCASPPPNMIFHGWVDDTMPHLMRAQVVIRNTTHDALSAFVREGLVAGRHVIFTHPVDGAIYVPVGDTEALHSAVNTLQQAHEAGTLTINKLSDEARNYLSDVEAQAATLAAHLSKPELIARS